MATMAIATPASTTTTTTTATTTSATPTPSSSIATSTITNSTSNNNINPTLDKSNFKAQSDQYNNSKEKSSATNNATSNSATSNNCITTGFTSANSNKSIKPSSSFEMERKFTLNSTNTSTTSTTSTTPPTMHTTTPTHHSSLLHESYPKSSFSSPPSVTSTSNSYKKDSNAVLPSELRRILYEVARTGLCSSLPWSSSNSNTTTATAAAAAAACNIMMKHHHSKINTATTSTLHHGGMTSTSLSGKRTRHRKSNSNTFANITMNTTTSSASGTGIGIGTTTTGGERGGSVGNRGKKRLRKDLKKSLNHITSSASSVTTTTTTATIPTRNGWNGNNSNPNTSTTSTTTTATSTTTTEDAKSNNDASMSSSTQLFNQNPNPSSTTATGGGGGSSSCCSESVSSVNTNLASLISAPSSTGTIATQTPPYHTNITTTTTTNHQRYHHPSALPYRSLRCAVRVAVELVLDYAFHTNGGYKVSHAEMQKLEQSGLVKETIMKTTSSGDGNGNSNSGSGTTSSNTHQCNTHQCNTHQSSGSNGTGGSSTKQQSNSNTTSSYTPNISKMAFTERQKELVKMLQGCSSSSSSSNHNDTNDTTTTGTPTGNNITASPNHHHHHEVNSDGYKNTNAPLSTSTSMSDITTVLTDEVGGTAAIAAGKKTSFLNESGVTNDASNPTKNTTIAATAAATTATTATTTTTGGSPSSSGNIHTLYRHSEMVQNKMKEKMLQDTRSAALPPLSSTMEEPPFTIQRVAEVLLTPEKYYTQTHKLCNAIEKLLLVSATSGAFGGVTGGDTSQSRREEREIAALADEKGREETELRQRRLKRRQSSTLFDCSDPVLQMNVSVEEPVSKRLINSGNNNSSNNNSSNNTTTNNNNNGPQCVNEQLQNESFNADHPSLTPNPLLGTITNPKSMSDTTDEMNTSIVTNSTLERENFSNTTSTGVSTNRLSSSLSSKDSSFPPLHIGAGAASSSASADIPQTLHTEVNRPPSPILFSAGSGAALDPLLNGHHNHNHPSGSAGLEGVVGGNRMQMEIVIDPAAAAPGTSSTRDLPVASYLEQVKGGFSSASDIESESDDLSFDDSASDRSDGSDCGSFSEPITAARVMALNRMQQQHRREQYLQSTRASSGLLQATGGGSGGVGGQGASQGGSGPGTNFLMDSEYQSGDSIDSTMAEDSCGSDSSSSDLAD